MEDLEENRNGESECGERDTQGAKEGAKKSVSKFNVVCLYDIAKKTGPNQIHHFKVALPYSRSMFSQSSLLLYISTLHIVPVCCLHSKLYPQHTVCHDFIQQSWWWQQQFVVVISLFYSFFLSSSSSSSLVHHSKVTLCLLTIEFFTGRMSVTMLNITSYVHVHGCNHTYCSPMPIMCNSKEEKKTPNGIILVQR